VMDGARHKEGSCTSFRPDIDVLPAGAAIFFIVFNLLL
jgi:hypothetical protein